LSEETAMTNNKPIDDPDAIRIAETTDVSPQQAAELLKKHGGDVRKAEEEARRFKAES
jgi:NACalpha-BTF3-like transcription factor